VNGEAGAQSAPPPAPPDEAKARKKQLVFSAIWLGAWLALALWCVLYLANSWPYIGHMLQFPFFIAMMGVVFRGFDVAMLAAGRHLKGGRRWLARIAAVLVGLGLGGQLASMMESRSMARFEQGMQAFILQVEARAAGACTGPPYPPALFAAYLESVDRAPSKPVASISHDAKRTIVTFMGWSADIDGSTIVYETDKRAWRRFHNDDVKQREALEAARKDQVTCKVTMR
jgi:hypothetical protein